MKVCDRCKAEIILEYDIRFGRVGNYNSQHTRIHDLCYSCVEWVKTELKELSARLVNPKLNFPQYLLTYPPGETCFNGALENTTKVAEKLLDSLTQGKSMSIKSLSGWRLMTKQPDGRWIEIGGSEEGKLV